MIPGPLAYERETLRNDLFLRSFNTDFCNKKLKFETKTSLIVSDLTIL